MSLADIITPISIIIEVIIAIAGFYTGFVLKKQAGILFGLSFLLFAVYDILSMMAFGSDSLAIVNILAVLSALIGVYLLIKAD